MQDDQQLNPFARTVKMAREAHNLSYYELEQRTGISRSEFSRIERGIRIPTPPTAAKIAEALELDVELLYDLLWHMKGTPLPSPPVYFRQKFDLSDEQVRQAERAIERIRQYGTSDDI